MNELKIGKNFFFALIIIYILILSDISYSQERDVTKRIWPHTRWVPILEQQIGTIWAVNPLDFLEQSKNNIRKIWFNVIPTEKSLEVFYKRLRKLGISPRKFSDFYEGKGRYFFDCNNKTYGISHEIFYDHEGDVIHSITIPDSSVQMNPIVPETIYEYLYNKVCMPEEVIKNFVTALFSEGCSDLKSCLSLFDKVMLDYIRKN